MGHNGPTTHESPQALAVAHRGRLPGYDENTVSAVVASTQHGADVVELDVHLSQDGVPMVIHDDTVDRTTDGHGRVADLTQRQLSRLVVGASGTTGVPTLEEVLRVPSIGLELEIRGVEPEQASVLLDVVTAAHALHRTTFTSSHRAQLRHLKEINGSVAVGVFAGACARHLHTDAGCNLMAWCRDLEPRRVHLPASILDRPRAEHLWSLGFEVQGANANSGVEMRRAITVADRVSTDHLDELLALRSQAGRRLRSPR